MANTGDVAGDKNTSTGFVLVERDDVLIAAYGVYVSPQQWKEVVVALRDSLSAKPKRVLIQDTTLMESLGPRERKAVADARHELKTIYQQMTSGICYVIKSRLIRAAVQATFWLEAPPVEHKVCQTRADALVWAESIRARGRPG